MWGMNLFSFYVFAVFVKKITDFILWEGLMRTYRNFRDFTSILALEISKLLSNILNGYIEGRYNFGGKKLNYSIENSYKNFLRFVL